MQQDDKQNIVIGEIAGLYGVQGWIKILSYTSPRENIMQYASWVIRRMSGGNWQSRKVIAVKKQGKGIIAKLDGIKDRTEAAGFLGWEIAIAEEQLPTLADNEFYWRDLYGLRVVDRQGQQLGQVDHMLETGANDVLVVRQDKQEHLIPYINGQVILNIDIANGEIQVDWDTDF